MNNLEKKERKKRKQVPQDLQATEVSSTRTSKFKTWELSNFMITFLLKEARLHERTKRTHKREFHMLQATEVLYCT